MPRIRSGVLVAGAVTTVTLDQSCSTVRVLNRDGTTEIWLTVDSGDDPSVGGDDCNCLPALIGASRVLSAGSEMNALVKMI